MSNYSRECNYQLCEYKCFGIYNCDTNNSNEWLYSNPSEHIYKLLTILFRKYSSISLTQLHKITNIPITTLYTALGKLIERNQVIPNNLGINCYLHNEEAYYYLSELPLSTSITDSYYNTYPSLSICFDAEKIRKTNVRKRELCDNILNELLTMSTKKLVKKLKGDFDLQNQLLECIVLKRFRYGKEFNVNLKYLKDKFFLHRIEFVDDIKDKKHTIFKRVYNNSPPTYVEYKLLENKNYELTDKKEYMLPIESKTEQRILQAKFYGVYDYYNRQELILFDLNDIQKSLRELREIAEKQNKKKIDIRRLSRGENCKSYTKTKQFIHKIKKYTEEYKRPDVRQSIELFCNNKQTQKDTCIEIRKWLFTLGLLYDKKYIYDKKQQKLVFEYKR